LDWNHPKSSVVEQLDVLIDMVPLIELSLACLNMLIFTFVPSTRLCTLIFTFVLSARLCTCLTFVKRYFRQRRLCLLTSVFMTHS